MIENWVKNGKTADGRQRLYNTVNKKSKIVEYKGFNVDLKFLALSLKLKGMSYRAIADIIGCSHPTIMRWHDKFFHLFDNDYITNNKDTVFEDVEIDEMFTYVKKKQKKFISG